MRKDWPLQIIVALAPEAKLASSSTLPAKLTKRVPQPAAVKSKVT